MISTCNSMTGILVTTMLASLACWCVGQTSATGQESPKARLADWRASAQSASLRLAYLETNPEIPTKGLDSVSASYESIRGTIVMRWKSTATLSAANQNEWIKHINERLAQKYPEMKLVAIQPSEGDRDRAFAETQTVLKVYPNVKLIMAIAAPAVPGAAEAVKQSGRSDVKVTGLSLPNMCRPYIHDGVIESIVLWNTVDLGYLTVYAASALIKDQLKRGDREMAAGRLGNVEIAGDEVRLGAPFIFNKENIDRFSF